MKKNYINWFAAGLCFIVNIDALIQRRYGHFALLLLAALVNTLYAFNKP